MESLHLDLILKTIGGSLFVRLQDVATLTGYFLKSLRNRSEKFPIAIRKDGGRTGVYAVELARYFDEAVASIPPAPAIEQTPVRRRVGAPTKRERLAAKGC